MELAFEYDNGLHVLRGSEELALTTAVKSGLFELCSLAFDTGNKPTEENCKKLREKINEVEEQFEEYRSFMDGVVKEVINGSEELTAARRLYGNNK